MNIIQSQSQPQQQRNKVKNILIRYCGNKEVKIEPLGDKNYQHPENVYLVKYFSKYYKSLTLVMKPQHSLLTKIKRIKKMRRFTGNFNDKVPQADWFKILGSSRKEIEEFPKIFFQQTDRFFWAMTTLHTIKFFFQITILQLPTYKCRRFKSKGFSVIWEALSEYLKSLRRLRILEIKYEDNSDFSKSLFNKVNRMPRLLGKLEVLKSSFSSGTSSDILQNKNVLSNLTKLNYISASSEVTPICQAIPQICKDLKSFSLSFSSQRSSDFRRDFQFHDFITPIQELPKLQSISISWPKDCSQDFWTSFVPPIYLRNLKLSFYEVNLTAFKELANQENLFDHWKEIKELDTLNFRIRCENGEEMRFTKNFMTAMLKKISKLISFQCWIDLQYQGIWRYEPFCIKGVPHLYGHLKKLKVRFSFDEGLSLGFDFALLKPFKKLKEIDLQAYPCSWANIGDVIHLLEENLKDGEFSTLKIGEPTISYPEELKDLLKKISKTKKSGANLKIELDVRFRTDDGNDNEIQYLEELCEIIESKRVKGLEILLDIEKQDCQKEIMVEVKRVLDLYPGIRNLTLQITDGNNTLQFLKKDGEKEQLLFNGDED